MAEYENVDYDSKYITKDQVQALFNHLRQHSTFEIDYLYFCIGMIDLSISDYAEGILNKPSEYNDYQYAQNDAIKAYELYIVCKDLNLDKYTATLRALWCDLSTVARNTLQDIPPKKGRGRPKTTALRNALIASIYRLYKPN